MAEIKEIADVASVLKDGQYQGTVDAATTSTDEIVKMMVGRELFTANYQSHAQHDAHLEVKNLSGRGFNNVSFVLKRGEILGFAGVLGAGRTHLARAIFGDERIRSGVVIKDGLQLKIDHPADAISNGIAYIPDERKSLGVFLEKTVAENIISAKLRSGVYDEKANRKVSQRYSEDLSIKTPDVDRPVRKLSGGNQQKVVLAKWLHTDPDILIVNEPTHGVDIGAKADIYKILKSLTEKGKSILLISSELPELLLLSDRVAVMYGGEIKSILTREEATEEKIAALASGL
jgi:ribose transport system ATP-binding protein